MKVLIACEFSGIIREAFAAKGHDAWSCDLLDTEIPGQHIKGNVLDILDDKWDLMVAHPPCTYLCRNGSKWKQDQNDISKSKEMFDIFFNSDIKKICIENPVPRKSVGLPKYSQIVQPWQFGHDYSKKTCLWLKGLPLLKPTNVIQISYITTKNGHRFTKGWYETPRNSKDRSRSFSGIASAMAEQWSNNHA